VQIADIFLVYFYPRRCYATAKSAQISLNTYEWSTTTEL